MFSLKIVRLYLIKVNCDISSPHGIYVLKDSWNHVEQMKTEIMSG